MDWTLVRAGRNTHIKIVVVALAAVIAVVTVGIHARIQRNNVARGPAVIRAGAPAAYAGQERASVRWAEQPRANAPTKGSRDYPERLSVETHAVCSQIIPWPLFVTGRTSRNTAPPEVSVYRIQNLKLISRQIHQAARRCVR